MMGFVGAFFVLSLIVMHLFRKHRLYFVSTGFHFFCQKVLDRENQMDNPCVGWLPDASWDNITELDKLTNFHGIITSFEQYPRDWNIWFTSAEPESTALPGG